MKLTVDYEWDVEQLDEHGDVLDHMFQTNAKDMLREQTRSQPSQMVLVRTEGNDDDGVTDRAWAYLDGDSLPEFFAKPMADGRYHPIGIRVPKRYHQELARALASRKVSR